MDRLRKQFLTRAALAFNKYVAVIAGIFLCLHEHALHAVVLRKNIVKGVKCAVSGNLVDGFDEILLLAERNVQDRYAKVDQRIDHSAAAQHFIADEQAQIVKRIPAFIRPERIRPLQSRAKLAKILRTQLLWLHLQHLAGSLVCPDWVIVARKEENAVLFTLQRGSHHLTRTAQRELPLNTLRSGNDKSERMRMRQGIVTAEIQTADDLSLRIVDGYSRAHALVMTDTIVFRAYHLDCNIAIQRYADRIGPDTGVAP